MHLVDSWANLSRWRHHPTEVTVLAGGLLLLALALPPVPCGFAILAVSAAAIVLGAGIPAGVYLRVMALPMSFLLAGSVALLFSVDVPDGRLAISLAPDGLESAGKVILRSLAAVSATLLLALSVPLAEVLSLLRRCHAPVVLVELMGLVYRLLSVFDDTLRDLLTAQSCRLGYRNLRTSYRSLGAAVASLFIRAIDRARRLEMGLAARGYQGELRVLSCRHAVSVRGLLLALATQLSIIALAVLWQGVPFWPR